MTYCCNCRKPTVWLSETPQHDTCQGCGTQFPCKGKKCGHADCEEARGEVTACETCQKYRCKTHGGDRCTTSPPTSNPTS